jgi:hypothetical protein
MRLVLIPAALLALGSLAGCTFDQMADIAMAANAMTSVAVATTAVSNVVSGPQPTVVYVSQAGAPVYSCPPGSYPINGGAGCMMDSSPSAMATGATPPATHMTAQEMADNDVIAAWQAQPDPADHSQASQRAYHAALSRRAKIRAAQADPNNPANTYRWQGDELVAQVSPASTVSGTSMASGQPTNFGPRPVTQPSDDETTRLQNYKLQQMSEGN